MTTPWYERFLELIGFDILLIGALFILAVLIARALLKRELPFTAFKRGWDDFRELFGLNTDASSQGTGVLQTAKAVGGGAAILLLAAAAGMVLDGVAHRVVDYEETGGLTIAQLFKFEMPDDRIKRKAFEAVAAPWTDVWDRCDPNGNSPDRGANQEWARRQAKELFHEAHLRVLDSGKMEVKSSLARDELLLKLFRVMLVLASALSLFALGTVWTSHVVQRGVLLLALVAASYLFLYLWSMQSRHYYKRVFHAYALIVPGNDQKPPSGFVPPEPYSQPVKCSSSRSVNGK